MQIVTFSTIKGGTGKSTSCAALAQAAVKEGKRVLCIDTDPQGNLSFFIGADPTQPGTYHLLHGVPAKEAIQTTEQGIDILASSPDLATEETSRGSATRLQKAIEPIKKKYDYIFIDTPPTMGEMVYNALQASTGLIIPLETDNSSLQGLYQITDIADQMRQSNPKLKIKGIVLTRYDSRPKLNRYLQEVIQEKGQELHAPLLMAIRPGIAIREAQSLQVSLYDYAPNSKPAEDYITLFKML